LVAVKSSVE
jgi:hypothetical protein